MVESKNRMEFFDRGKLDLEHDENKQEILSLTNAKCPCVGGIVTVILSEIYQCYM